MSITLYWRQPQLSDEVHLSEPSAHRALCGADVLNAFTDKEAPRHMACTHCMDIAERDGLRRPPLSSLRVIDRHTQQLFRPAK